LPVGEKKGEEQQVSLNVGKKGLMGSNSGRTEIMEKEVREGGRYLTTKAHPYGVGGKQKVCSIMIEQRGGG